MPKNYDKLIDKISYHLQDESIAFSVTSSGIDIHIFSRKIRLLYNGKMTWKPLKAAIDKSIRTSRMMFDEEISTDPSEYYRDLMILTGICEV